MTRLAREGICSDEERAGCLEEHEEYLERACRHCKKLKPADIHPYTAQLLRLYRLIRAGYPLGPDDLSLRGWMDLALVAETMDEERETQRWARLLARLMR